MSSQIYQDLPPFERFEQLADLAQFTEVDESWSVVISDIRGSTKAIEAGRYKEVNLIGAATIAAIRNAIGVRDFPFVFGGDGASVLLPGLVCERLHVPLIRLQKMSLAKFGLELRVAIIPVREVRARGGKILLSKFKMAPGAHLAMIQGGGLRIADQLAKSPEGAEFRLKPELSTDETAPDLASLSCRWAPLQNRNGAILSVLIQARNSALASQVYGTVLEAIHPIFEIESSRPMAHASLVCEPFLKSLWREMKLHDRRRPREILNRVLIPMLYLRVARLFPRLQTFARFRAYLQDTLTNTDYKKLDDTLRMVLDCSPSQDTKLREVLEGFYQTGTIYFGIHRSDAALMTCLMESMDSDQHIHFIDGADGGYAMAAKELKNQMSADKDGEVLAAPTQEFALDR